MNLKIALALLFVSIASLAHTDIATFEELITFTGNGPAGGGQYFNGNSGSNTTNSN